MTNVHRLLANKLDAMPNGYPATESGIELKILKKIFTAEEAEMALNIKAVPETAATIAERLGKPVEEMTAILDAMVDKGQIARRKMSGQVVYIAMPFLIGIYEYQLNRMDKELTELFEEYFPNLIKTVGGFPPALTRVVPINARIDAKLEVLRYEDMRRMLEEAKSFSVRDCICRAERALEGNPCKHPLEICMAFSSEENAFENATIGRPITKEEALKLLEKAEEEGLVHNTYNVKAGQSFVCNCCSCCCGLMRGLKEFNAPHMIARSNFMASINKDTCSACGTCAEERCPVGAIFEEGDVYTVQAELCIGCGVCTVTCLTESITLVRRPESELNAPSDNILAWRNERASSRGIELKP